MSRANGRKGGIGKWERRRWAARMAEWQRQNREEFWRGTRR